LSNTANSVIKNYWDTIKIISFIKEIYERTELEVTCCLEVLSSASQDNLHALFNFMFNFVEWLRY